MISILFLAADPTDASRLRLGEEAREIQEKLRLAKLRDDFEFQQRTSVRPTDISQALLDTNPQIVHFSGHGTSAGAICVEDNARQIHPIQPDALAALFEQFKTQVDCVVMNACYSEIQARAISHHIRFVIGMNQAIGDRAAIAFSIGFYQAIGAGRSVEEAYKLGCVQIRLHNIPEHLTPVLIKDVQVPAIQNLAPVAAAKPQHEMRINLPGLLKLLGSNIYADIDAAVREMIQNAHDTCIIRMTKDPSYAKPQINVSYDRAAETLTFSDNGTGMTENELHEYLSTIGRGFTQLQRQSLQDANAQEALLLIGQFGIGMLSAFSVSNQVEVFTRSYLPGAQGFKWVCAGDIHYSIEPFAKPETGTRLVLHLSDKGLALLESNGERLRRAIRKYADFLSIPVILEGYGQVNSITPPWQSQSADLQKYLQERYGLGAIDIIPLNYSKPHLEGLLFVPLSNLDVVQDYGDVDILVARMFVAEKNKELLPTWARFIKGIINSADLKPTLSRDAVVKDDAYHQVRALLHEAILNHLEGLAHNDLRKLDAIVGVYNNAIKQSALADDAFFRRIAPLVRVSTASGKMTIAQYLSNSNNVLYYLSKSGGQYKSLAAEKGLNFIDASWGMEKEFLEKYAQVFGATLKPLESEMLLDSPAIVDDKWRELEMQFKQIMGIEAQVASFDPDTVPALLVEKETNQDELSGVGLSASQMRQAFTQMKQAKAERDQRLLRLNIKNSLMQTLRDMNRNETFQLALTVIYYNASILARQYVSPSDLEAIVASTTQACTVMVTNACQVDELQSHIARMEMELDEARRK